MAAKPRGQPTQAIPRLHDLPLALPVRPSRQSTSASWQAPRASRAPWVVALPTLRVRHLSQGSLGAQGCAVTIRNAQMGGVQCGAFEPQAERPESQVTTYCVAATLSSTVNPVQPSPVVSTARPIPTSAGAGGTIYDATSPTAPAHGSDVAVARVDSVPLSPPNLRVDPATSASKPPTGVPVCPDKAMRLPADGCHSPLRLRRWLEHLAGCRVLPGPS
jgi:hypothetical protein